jgi:hypothetical protein
MKFSKVVGPPNPLGLKITDSADRLEETTDNIARDTQMPELANGSYSRNDLHEHTQAYGAWHFNKGKGRQ